MLLAIDIGNTNIVVGVFRGEELVKHWRVSTLRQQTADEYGIILLNLFSSYGIKPAEVKGAIVSSVVPSLNKPFKDALLGYFGVTPLIVGEEGVDPLIKVLTDNPSEVGADRIVNAVAAYREYKRPLIVVDFGTAVTFDYINEKGDYSGGVIAPGISISVEALFTKTAKLPRVEVKRPERMVGKNTVESMQAGIFYGFISLVDGIIERMIAEVGTSPKVIATGGLAQIAVGSARYITETDEFLTLKGLMLIYEGNSK